MASIKGTHNDDVLDGAGDDDEISGRSGDDVLRGRGGDDVLSGGSGDDELRGGAGDDELHGGSGDDELRGGAGDDELHGGSGDDELRGGAGDDELHGGSGDDELRGGAGDDELRGGAGDDELRGGTGDDELQGGAGDDELRGGSGDDELTGGPGDDTFAFTNNSGADIITDLGQGDTIDLTALSGITDIGDVIIEQSGDDTVITLPDGSTIKVLNADVADVIGQIEVPCLMRGTMVMTPKGEVPVEKLAVGDEVLTVDATAETIKWIGRRAYARPFLSRGERIAPIVFEVGSLGPNQPDRPLYVSPEHAIYVDYVLVPARLLVNGMTIRQVMDFDLVEYFHLEFDEAQVIVANGALNESYVESGNRRMFSNYGEFVEIYGEMPAEASGRRRFQLLTSGAAVQAIHRRLSDRSAVA